MLIGKRDFFNFLTGSLPNFDNVIVAEKEISSSVLYLKKIGKDAGKKIELNSFRSTNPLKYFLYHVREKVYPAEEKFPLNIIVGVKACDLKAVQILDKALLNENFTDPAYYQWRKNTYLVSADCDEITESCHCNLVDGKPFADEGYDLNLSSLDGYYEITVGSGKGKNLVDRMTKEFSIKDSSDEERKIIKEKREQVLKKLIEQNKDSSRKENYGRFRNVEMKNWEDESSNCVGCGACTNICPTCYCIILNDESKLKSEEFIKVRSYDSCQWFGYARVAGGGTPRSKMHQRFRNRYLCKFDYMPSNFAETGCTGCGRCIDACPAGIDFRKVVHNTSINAEQLI
ncbi:MAG TPA: 4Fe-4S dicluster domain-containing protein [Ignavibacteriaceae bacterium]|nr:4Fe-4S dicluster domain-containing protein [Ignavibacteriaceae bacterium]